MRDAQEATARHQVMLVFLLIFARGTMVACARGAGHAALVPASAPHTLHVQHD